MAAKAADQGQFQIERNMSQNLIEYLVKVKRKKNQVKTKIRRVDLLD
jgi:hypothetical protein